MKGCFTIQISPLNRHILCIVKLMILRPAQAIEFFHLAFLQVLQRRVDQRRYILKGGANLRYFFPSFRYSEGIDLDVSGIERWDLEERIDGVLASAALSTLLRGNGIAIAETSKTKQTETTQRWTLGLSLPSQTEPLRTKIEFSRRNSEDRHLLEAVPARITDPYRLLAPSLRHYLAAPATEQKIEALALRSETQARDVFDLDLLLRPNLALAGGSPAELRETAAERALALPFSAFRDQVIPFLDPEIAELYDEDAWKQIQGFVVERLFEAP